MDRKYWLAFLGATSAIAIVHSSTTGASDNTVEITPSINHYTPKAEWYSTWSGSCDDKIAEARPMNPEQEALFENAKSGLFEEAKAAFKPMSEYIKSGITDDVQPKITDLVRRYCDVRIQVGNSVRHVSAPTAAAASKALLPRFTHVVSGGHSTCGIHKDSQPVCWGSLGRTVSGQTQHIEVARYQKASCELRTGGHLQCWDSKGLKALPQKVLQGKFKQLSIGERITCGVTDEDESLCWSDSETDFISGWRDIRSVKAGGASRVSLLKNSGKVISMANTSPSFVERAGPYISVDEGYDFTCAITSKGQISCWGQSPPSGIPAGKTFTTVVAGFAHACALTDAGKIECWGTLRPRYPRAKASKSARRKEASEFPKPPSGKYLSISAGTEYSCGVTAAGQVNCWGYQAPDLNYPCHRERTYPSCRKVKKAAKAAKRGKRR